MQLSVESAALANYPVAEFFPLPDGNVVVGHPKTERGAGDKIDFFVALRMMDVDMFVGEMIVVFVIVFVFGRTAVLEYFFRLVGFGFDRPVWLRAIFGRKSLHAHNVG